MPRELAMVKCDSLGFLHKNRTVFFYFLAKNFYFWQKFLFLTKISIFDKNFYFWQKIDFLDKKSYRILSGLARVTYKVF